MLLLNCQTQDYIKFYRFVHQKQKGSNVLPFWDVSRETFYLVDGTNTGL